MSDYHRVKVKGGTYFFTVNLQDRSQTWLIDYVDVLRESVANVKRQRPFKIHAWVVLPDHMHAIWTLPKGDDNYSVRWREIKKQFTKNIPVNEFRTHVNINRGERAIWQKRFWEHYIIDEMDFNRHFDYVHINPVKHGHVKAVKDWPYSSFHRSVERGIYDLNWAGLEAEDVNGFE